MEASAESPYAARALSFLADIRFHLAYSDIGDPVGEPPIVCGGLYSSRYTLAQADELAKRQKVRLITPDKPGIGGTEAVDINQKVNTWLAFSPEIVQALAHHLNLHHVALLGHSSGAIYVLNTLLHLRRLLHPTHPYAALFTPWVHPAESDAPTSSIATLLPDWAIHKWYETSHLLSRTGITPLLGPSTARPGVKMPDHVDDMARAVDEKIMEYALLENVEGVSQEALFCLKRGGGQGGKLWGAGGWDGYGEFIALLKKREQEQERGGGGGKVELDVFFSESDSSSGERGSDWFAIANGLQMLTVVQKQWFTAFFDD
ncbi:hypothetical protein B0I37DRAFT_433056 [Chaetomium sp. MPI-CAGE-AT-0009]|nr:hypothetical protein B0I37DRAFT_433056 [Chaetomium sp. MPI-CAGE-AT-0009]